MDAQLVIIRKGTFRSGPASSIARTLEVKAIVPDEVPAAEVQATHDLASAMRSLLLDLCGVPISASLPARSVLNPNL